MSLVQNNYFNQYSADTQCGHHPLTNYAVSEISTSINKLINGVESFCNYKEQKQIIIDLDYINTDYKSLSHHFVVNKRYPESPECRDIILITNIIKLYTECREIVILNKREISSSYLNQLMEENKSLSHKNTSLAIIKFVNVYMDDIMCNDIILDHYKSEFRKKHYELTVSKNSNNQHRYDLILKNIKNVLLESSEYKEIYQKRDELLKLLMRNPCNKEYKTPNDLCTERIDCQARDIENECESMKRIKVLLTRYQTLMNSSKLGRKVSLLPILNVNNTYTATQIYDDFIHIKDHIDDDEKLGLELIQKLQTKFDCTKCAVWGRWRYRSTYSYPKWFNDEDIVFQEQCDKIHSYLIHYADDHILNHRQSVNTKPNRQYIGKKEDDQWWNYNINDNAAIYRESVEKMGIFRWQCAHGFNSKQYEGLMHLKPKYKNVKEEVLYNSYYHLSTDGWNQTLRKAAVFFKSFCKQRIKTCYDGKYNDFITQQITKWKKNEVIEMEEIVILKLYTDLDKLQYELKKCFRFETISDIFTLNDFDPNNRNKYDFGADNTKKLRYKLEERLQTFYWWRVGLLTVLNKYGQALSNKIPLFHGVNDKMIINNWGTQGFCGPLSTSSSYHVARTFATAKGMVLQISSQYPRLGLCRGFNASIISDYPEEKEWLIGFGYLKIKTVLTRPLNKNWKTFDDIDNEQNYYKIPESSETRSIFFAIHLFRQQIFSMSPHLEYWLSAFLYLHCGYNVDVAQNKYDNGRIKKTKFVIKLFEIVRSKENNEAHRYWRILNILWERFDNFRKYPNNKQVVKIDEISENLKPYFMDYDGNDIQRKEKYIISFTKFVSIFENVREIHFINNYLFDNNALRKLIEYIQKNPNHKLRKIKFLYYDYDKSKCYPTDPKIFCDPEQLDKNLLTQLNQNKWKLKHKIIGKTGYQIQLFSTDKDIGKSISSLNNQHKTSMKIKLKRDEKPTLNREANEFKLNKKKLDPKATDFKPNKKMILNKKELNKIDETKESKDETNDNEIPIVKGNGDNVDGRCAENEVMYFNNMTCEHIANRLSAIFGVSISNIDLQALQQCRELLSIETNKALQEDLYKLKDLLTSKEKLINRLALDHDKLESMIADFKNKVDILTMENKKLRKKLDLTVELEHKYSDSNPNEEKQDIITAITLAVNDRKLNPKRAKKKKTGDVSYDPSSNSAETENINIYRSIFKDINKKSKIIKFPNYRFMSDFMGKSTAMQFNDNEVKIIKCDKTGTIKTIVPYDIPTETDKILYGMIEPIKEKKRNFEKKMDKLYTSKQIKQRYNIPLHELPQSSRQKRLFALDIRANHMDRIKNAILMDSNDKNWIIKRAKWQNRKTIPIFGIQDNNRRMTLQLRKPRLIQQCQEFMDKNNNFNLIPIVLFNNKNKHWIEFVLITRIEKNIDIGISFKFDESTTKVVVSGIHLDKQLLLEQHYLIDAQHSMVCHCLDNFESIITDFRCADFTNIEQANECRK